jgi:hypothetical protein
MYSAVGKARMISPEQRKREWDLAVNNLRVVCDMAGERNLEIALEPLNRFESDLINTAADVVRLIEDISHPAAKIILDGFHMNIEERDVEKAIISAGDKLIHFQVSENYRGTPGTGQTRWDAYKRGLEAINYKGFVSIESFTPENQELAGAVCFWHPMAESQDKVCIGRIILFEAIICVVYLLTRLQNLNLTLLRRTLVLEDFIHPIKIGKARRTKSCTNCLCFGRPLSETSNQLLKIISWKITSLMLQ